MATRSVTVTATAATATATAAATPSQSPSPNPVASDSQRIVQQQRRQQQDELRSALRALLMRPLMGPQHEALPAVRRHAEALRDWFQAQAGWSLSVERDGARLFKRPADLHDSSRGLPRFDRARYVLLCLACAVLERAEAQISLRALGERLLVLAAEPALASRGYSFLLQSQSERRALVGVCQTLLGLGVLERVAGDEEGFVQDLGQQGDALYDVRRRALAGVLAAVRGPSTWPAGSEPVTLDERLAALVQELVPDNEDSQRQALRQRLARRLLDDPVVYLADLNAAERAYFSNQRGALAARLAEATGLVAEQRAEGTALTDEGAELSDIALPAEGTEAHATLLVAQWLAGRRRQDVAAAAMAMAGAAGAATDVAHGEMGDGAVADGAVADSEVADSEVADSEVAAGEVAPGDVAITEVAHFLAQARATHGRFWRKAAREPGGEHELAAAALQRLHSLHLLRLHDGWVTVRPAIARYVLGETMPSPAPRTSVPARPLVQDGLFDTP